MIIQIDTINGIEPIYKEYLAYMRQFFDIVHYDSWCESAMKNLQRYSNSDDRHIYILKESNTIIGFALVNKHLRFNSDGFGVSEFYIQKGYQKKGYGRKLAEHLFEAFKGNWEIAVSLTNTSALLFWEQVVSVYAKGEYVKRKKASFNGYGFVFNSESGSVNSQGPGVIPT